MPVDREFVNETLGLPTLKPRGTTGYSQEVIPLNDFGLAERRRTTPKGKTTSRYSVSIESELLLHQFNDQLLGERPANAIAEVIQEGIRKISDRAKESTIVFRHAADAALGRSARWAVNRYRRGRLKGDFRPGTTDRLFNDSGRLAEGIHVRENRAESGWTVNVPANRLDPRTFRSQADFLAMVEDLQARVPELGNPRALVGHAKVREEIRGSIQDLIKKAQAINVKKKRELRRAVAGLFTGNSQLVDLFF